MVFTEGAMTSQACRAGPSAGIAFAFVYLGVLTNHRDHAALEGERECRTNRFSPRRYRQRSLMVPIHVISRSNAVGARPCGAMKGTDGFDAALPFKDRCMTNSIEDFALACPRRARFASMSPTGHSCVEAGCM